jgi:hypothetical protein
MGDSLETDPLTLGQVGSDGGQPASQWPGVVIVGRMEDDDQDTAQDIRRVGSPVSSTCPSTSSTR